MYLQFSKNGLFYLIVISLTQNSQVATILILITHAGRFGWKAERQKAEGREAEDRGQKTESRTEQERCWTEDRWQKTENRIEQWRPLVMRLQSHLYLHLL